MGAPTQALEKLQTQQRRSSRYSSGFIQHFPSVFPFAVIHHEGSALGSGFQLVFLPAWPVWPQPPLGLQGAAGSPVGASEASLTSVGTGQGGRVGIEVQKALFITGSAKDTQPQTFALTRGGQTGARGAACGFLANFLMCVCVCVCGWGGRYLPSLSLPT